MARVTRHAVAGVHHETPADARAHADELNRQLRQWYLRELADARTRRAQLEDVPEQERLELIPDPEEPEQHQPEEVHHQRVYDVVSSRDGEPVVRYIRRRSVARQEAARLNGQVSGEVQRFASLGDDHGVPLPPHPTALNRTFTDAAGSEHDQPLVVADPPEYAIVEYTLPERVLEALEAGDLEPAEEANG